MLNLTTKKKSIIEQTVNVFETGSRWGNYACLAFLPDGPNGIVQITYGRSQTTEFGNLGKLLTEYVARGGKYSNGFEPYLTRVGKNPLSQDTKFISLLKLAGTGDPIMSKVQDDFFEDNYFKPSLNWAETNGFTHPLSLLVIYDSFIHSGSIPKFLRIRFPEKTPKNGGDEKDWISAYVSERDKWLGSHSNKILRPTVYRMKCMKKQIELGNWDLSVLPIETQGLKITGEPRVV